MSHLSLNQITRPALVAPTIGETMLINGDFPIDQRASDGSPITVTTDTNTYGADRFGAFLLGVDTAVFTLERRSDTPPPGFEQLNYH